MTPQQDKAAASSILDNFPAEMAASRHRVSEIIRKAREKRTGNDSILKRQ
jgi:hypothetical protein